MKTIVLPQQDLLERVAAELCGFVHEKPDAVITIAAGRTMFPVWERLGTAVKAGELSMKKLRFFQTAEFLNVKREASLRNLTEKGLLSRTDLPMENCRWFADFEDCAAYEEAIQEAGGLDLALLGIGDNAHIGLNEPGTQFETRSRIQKLTNKTKTQYAWLSVDQNSFPEKACTMGIQTLIGARKILIVCLGEEKAKAVFDMLYARNDSVVPAAFLQLHHDVTIFVDTEAAKLL